MPKTTTVKLSDSELESLQNVIAVLKGEPFDEGHIQFDVARFSAIMKKATDRLKRFHNACSKSLVEDANGELYCDSCGWRTRKL